MTQRVILDGADHSVLIRQARGNDKAVIKSVLDAIECAPYDKILRLHTCDVRLVLTLIRDLRDRSIVISPTPSLRALFERTVVKLREEEEIIKDLVGDIEPYEYQREGIGFLWKKRACILADDMGLGKTMQFLLSILPDGQALVLCPASLKQNWASEVQKWRRDLVPIVVSKRTEFRYPRRGEVLIVNHELLPRGLSAGFRAYGMPWHGTHYCVDEAHQLFRAGSLRTKNHRLLRKRIHSLGGYLVLCTGTPFRNRLKDLWTTLVNADLHKSTYGSFTGFVKKVGGVKDPTERFGYIFDPEKVPDDALLPVMPYFLRREKSDVLAELPPKSKSLYKLGPVDDPQLSGELDNVDVDRLIEYLNDESPVPADMSTVVSSSRRRLAKWKLDKLLPFIGEYEYSKTPLVVFSAHRLPVETLGERPGWAYIHGGVSSARRQEIVDRFQAGDYVGLAMTIQTGGLGYTLTYASHSLFVDLSYVPPDNRQAEDRLWRISQEKNVVVTIAVADHPLDYRVSQLLREKTDMEDRTLGLLKRPPSMRARDLADSLEKLAVRM